MTIKKIILLTALTSVLAGVNAQKTTIFTNENKDYNRGLELYDKEKYSAAQETFEQIIQQADDTKSELIVNAYYYHALCGLELFNDDAEGLFIEFVLKYPDSPKLKLAYFHLGRYYFRKKKYDQSIEWLDKIDVYDLSEENKAEYYFKKGYSYLIEDMLVKSSAAFFEIKDVDNAYSNTAKYYYAHIAYLQEKYEAALQTFLMIKNDEKFSPIVPYYITQIYYLQEKYDELIAYAPALLDTAIPKRVGEISRLIGDAYFKTEQYPQAIPYLQKYIKEKPYDANKGDYYQLGFAYYKADSCDKALPWLKKSISKNDSLTQMAHYHLAECYLKMNEKRYAQSSFREAAIIDFDKEIQEDALFSFAKISYELSYHPFNDAIKAFEKFINTYPNSTKLNDAYEFLVAVYFTTKNYKAALASLENIKKLDVQLQEAYQKIAHYRGIELFNNQNYADAIVHFDKSDKYPLLGEVKAENAYWRAEAYYRLDDYEKAAGAYKQVLYEPNAIAYSFYNDAHYNLGYAYFKMKEYSNAQSWFRKYVQNETKEKSKLKNDALNRIGDCFFIQKEYKSATEFYDKAAMIGMYQLEYSLYQSAISNGVMGNYNDKISLLTTLINKKQASHLLDDAIYELAKTQQDKNKNDEALKNFNLLINEHPNSTYISKALLKRGLIYYNQKADDNALISFKKVVNDYPGTEEAKQALATIKKIYIDKGSIEQYENYLAGVQNVDSAQMIMDKDYFEVAENSFMSGNCDKATADFTKYLEKYPNGTYKIQAHYYKAVCEQKAGFKNEALMDFEEVIKHPKNAFTEDALLNAAKLSKMLAQPEKALNYFSKLEYLADIQDNVFLAQVEQMRLNFELENHDNTIKYCEMIINKDIDNKNLLAETHLIYGKTALKKDDYNKAFKEFSTAAAASNKFGVEAKYNVANILYMRGDYNLCEAEVFSLIKVFPSYDYWIGKSLILLADNYVAKEDIFQAKITLKNVKDNSKHQDLVATATEKLNIIEAQENKREKQEEDEIELKLYDNVKLDDLFYEEEKIIDEENNNANNQEETENE